MTVDLLIDGDLFLYKAACGCEKEVQWDEENHVLWSNVQDAWGALKQNLDALPFPTDGETVIAITGKNNFRKELFPLYKANRQGARKPMCYSALVQRLKDNYKVVSYDGLEADDVLGILATKPSNRARIIVSDDKDMATVPCTLYAKGEVRKVTEEEADYNHMYQTLTGDQADGYPGCPGIGPVKAKTILDPCMESNANEKSKMWEAVVSAFHAADQSNQYALTQARLARILRWSDWDSDKKEPILWTPTL